MDIKVKEIEGKHYIYSVVRNKYVRLTPEEYVRQKLVLLLVHKYKYPLSFFSEEHSIMASTKRYDILIYSRELTPYMLIEVKSPYVKISETHFKQLLSYNSKIGARYLVLTNGEEFSIYDTQDDKFLQDLPVFS